MPFVISDILPFCAPPCAGPPWTMCLPPSPPSHPPANRSWTNFVPETKKGWHGPNWFGRRPVFVHNWEGGGGPLPHTHVHMMGLPVQILLRLCHILSRITTGPTAAAGSLLPWMHLQTRGCETLSKIILVTGKAPSCRHSAVHLQQQNSSRQAG